MLEPVKIQLLVVTDSGRIPGNGHTALDALDMTVLDVLLQL